MPVRRASGFFPRPGRYHTIDSLLERYVLITEHCWYWTGSVGGNGYGKFHRACKNVLAHRFVYEQLVGPIADGLQIDHLCRNVGCVNPAHLEAVTPRVNSLRSEGVQAINARKTHCIRVHPLSGDNLYVTPDGRRQCRICRAKSQSDFARSA